MHYKIYFSIIILISFNVIGQKSNLDKQNNDWSGYGKAIENTTLKATPKGKTVALSWNEISSKDFARGADAADQSILTLGEEQYITDIYNKEKNNYLHNHNSDLEYFQYTIANISKQYHFNYTEQQFLLDLIAKENQKKVLIQNSIWSKVGVIGALILVIILFIKIKI